MIIPPPPSELSNAIRPFFLTCPSAEVDRGGREREKYTGKYIFFPPSARLQIYLHYRIESFERRPLSIFRKTDFSLRFMYRREYGAGNFSIPFAANAQ